MSRNNPIVEQVARAIYDVMRSEDALGKDSLGKNYPWVDGGNSDKQDEARRLARAALASLSVPTPSDGGR